MIDDDKNDAAKARGPARLQNKTEREKKEKEFMTVTEAGLTVISYAAQGRIGPPQRG